MRNTRWILPALAILAIVSALFAAGGWAGHRATVLRLEERGTTALAQAIDRLQGQIDRYRYLPAVLSHHPTIQSAVATDVPQTLQEANDLMRRIADTSGAQVIYLMDATGLTVASSNWDLPQSFIGQRFDWRPYFARAIQGGLGYTHAVGTTSRERGFYFGHPVRDPGGGIIGVLTVKLDLERLESSWRADPNVVFFADDRGVIFLANRYALILRSLSPQGARPPTTLAEERQYAGQEIAPLPGDPRGEMHGRPAWLQSDVAFVPERAVWLSAPIETLGLTGNILVDSAEARVQAALWGALTATTGGLLMLAVLIVLQRRNALRRQLATEERAKNRLESEVLARTAELSHTNTALRAEVAERTAAEAALRDVQDQLVQAGKLKGLGELSAGISHELNQPLTAIQTMADNAEVLLARDRPEEAQATLSRIKEIAARAGRIIRNLRAFARKEALTVEDVDLACVVEDALDITGARLRQTEARLAWAPPASPVMVRGGRVRLTQVVVNLISNGLDAMEGQDGPRQIALSIQAEGARVHLAVEDSGPGLNAPDQVFDPFYTTKQVGEGMGLGLSISYGIVQSFGGAIRGENRAEGGARFVVELTAAGAGEVAA